MPAPQVSLPSRPPKTSHPSLSSITLVPQLSALLVVAVAPFSGVVVSAAPSPSGVAVGASSVLVLAVARVTATLINVAVAVVEAVVLAGRIMTSPSAPVNPQSTFGLNGRCWRRLTSAVFRS